MRICSLLPSATEILFALGLGDQVVGISHECDYPPEAASRLVLTRCAFDSKTMTQAEIDAEVRRLAREEKSLYEVDDLKLREAAPDLIVTQDLCHVCAVTPDEVSRAIGQLPKPAQILSLNPTTLEDVFADILKVAQATGIRGSKYVDELQARVKAIAPATTLENKPTVGCIEWLEPLWRTGHWVPEMVQLAGGTEPFAEIGKPSRTLTWEELESRDPEILVIMPCGYDLEKTRTEFDRVRNVYPWEKLRSFRNNRVYLTDANSYFSRSGPRLVDGLELLAELIHPEYFANIAPVHSYSGTGAIAVPLQAHH